MKPSNWRTQYTKQPERRRLKLLPYARKNPPHPQARVQPPLPRGHLMISNLFRPILTPKLQLSKEPAKVVKINQEAKGNLEDKATKAPARINKAEHARPLPANQTRTQTDHRKHAVLTTGILDDRRSNAEHQTPAHGGTTSNHARSNETPAWTRMLPHSYKLTRIPNQTTINYT